MPLPLAYRKLILWLLAMSLLSPMALAIIGVYYTDRVEQRTEHHFVAIQQQSDGRWCGLLAAIDVPVSPLIKDPVQRARSVAVVKYIHILRIDLQCIKA
jgi:hypothetical protein